MENVLLFPDHAHASEEAGFKKAPMGTAPPVTSLNRIASFKDTPRRPAKMLRKCASEQGTASASCPIDISLASAQRSRGWEVGSDMTTTISTRNGKSQPEIFPSETPEPIAEFLKCDMAKHAPDEPREIFLGDWLKHFKIGPSEAAAIADCDQSYISNIIAGRKTNINVLYLLRLSEHMDLNINDFFRPLPSGPQLAAFKALSPKAQAAILNPKKQKA